MTRCLIIGATGYLGSLLTTELTDLGHDVRVLVRDPRARAAFPKPVDVRVGDATDPRSVREALRDVDLGYFLMHSLDRRDFSDVDRRAAEILVTEAARADVGQLVYVGGTRPPVAGPGSVSEHLSSRAEVGDILLDSPVPALVLQASMIIGTGSTSFDLLKQAALKTPFVPFPGWMNHTSKPVAVADVLHYLTSAARCADRLNGRFDVSGPETLSYLSLLQRCARVAGAPVRLPIPLPVWSHTLASTLVGLTTRISTPTAAALFASLRHDLIPRDDDITTVLPAPADGPTSVDSAIREACQDTNPARATSEAIVDERVLRCAGTVPQTWQTITDIGGDNGWHTVPLVWLIRGALDHLLGGIGLYRGRQHHLTPGDVVDFWTVLERDDHQHRLLLRADMKMPGHTLLELSVHDNGTHTSYRQKIIFTPSGTAGRLYWQAQKPLHDIVFATMAHNIARAVPHLRPTPELTW